MTPLQLLRTYLDTPCPACGATLRTLNQCGCDAGCPDQSGDCVDRTTGDEVPVGSAGCGHYTHLMGQVLMAPPDGDLDRNQHIAYARLSEGYTGPCSKWSHGNGMQVDNPASDDCDGDVVAQQWLCDWRTLLGI